MKLPSCEQTRAVTLAIYSGMPIDSLGTFGLFQSGPEKSVLIRPGAMPLTRMPSLLNSSFIHLIMFSSAALVDPYTPIVQLGIYPVTDDMIQTLASGPAAFSNSYPSLIRKKVLLTFKSHILSYAFSVMSI